VLDRLRSAALYTSLKKYTFTALEVKFLGFIVTRDRIAADPEKIATIKDWPVPKDLKELQSFLGFANFYRRFIERYAKRAAPITELLKGNATFE